ncbi:MAG TPA: nuclease-related domain-containing protein [Solirubrobacteraceae bacterium]|nr:nuclease-related domain-containing protein [Solirubrobacteraceae bacterium]
MRDALYLRRCGAGGSAERRFNEMRARWWKRVRFRATTPLAVVGAALLIGALIFRSVLPEFLIGVALGAVFAMYIWVTEAPPPRIEQWRTGYEGEQKTARRLAQLRREGYELFHDLSDRLDDQPSASNVDHVVVGPTGVWLIDTKWLSGTVHLDGDIVEVTNVDWPEDMCRLERLLPAMRGRAARLCEDIGPVNGRRPFVNSVLVFWNDVVGAPIEADRVVLLRADELASRILESGDVRLSADAVAEIASRIRATRHPRTDVGLASKPPTATV